MRLSDFEANTVVHAARVAFGEGVRVYLFGSRTDDNARGGDIDLYIETALEQTAAFQARLSFEAAMIMALGDRKIDVLVKPHDRAPTPFERVARRGSVLLDGA